jgi:hypothetical protein
VSDVKPAKLVLLDSFFNLQIVPDAHFLLRGEKNSAGFSPAASSTPYTRKTNALTPPLG